MKWRLMPLRLMIPLSLLVFTGGASLVNYWADWGYAERALEASERDDLLGQANRLQGTLEHLLRRGDQEQVQAELAALGAAPEIVLALLIDEGGRVMGSTRRADLDQPMAAVMPWPPPGKVPAPTCRSSRFPRFPPPSSARWRSPSAASACAARSRVCAGRAPAISTSTSRTPTR